MSPPALVLFDLDGTLVDTAPDLAAAANRQRGVHGLAPLPLAQLRPMASHGSRGMIGVALGSVPGDPGFDSLREEFLAFYAAALCVHSRLFDGMAPLLDDLDARGVRWGIVTNKPARYTDPLVQQLGLSQRAACVVSGDTTAHAKPHPGPLHHALQLARTAAQHAIYVGDDQRDIQAGRAAGLRTIAVGYGYLGDGAPPQAWGADAVVETPAELHEWLFGA